MEQEKEGERLEDRGLDVQRRRADMEGVQARTQATIAGTKDVELERQYRQAQIEKMGAETQAKLTGKPQKFMEYDPETGMVYESFFYPDGRIERGGQSGGAQIKREGIDAQNQRTDRQIQSREGIVDKQIGSREKIVGMQQRGATGRTAMTQAGQNQRQKERLAAGGTIPAIGSVPYGPAIKRASKTDINDFAREKKITPAEAKARFEAKGYIVE